MASPMNARARNFLAASEVSPVVYCSADDGRVTYRLADGKMFYLNTAEARQAPNPRWVWLEHEANSNAARLHKTEERKLLAKLTTEASSLELQPERGR